MPFKYIWLTNEQNLSIDAFYGLLDVQLFVAEQTKEYIDLLNTSSPLDRIILIVDESLARNIVELTHDQCAIKVIFVIRSTTRDFQFDEWVDSYIKVTIEYTKTNSFI